MNELHMVGRWMPAQHPLSGNRMASIRHRKGQANPRQKGFVGRPLRALNSNWVKETK